MKNYMKVLALSGLMSVWTSVHASDSMERDEKNSTSLSLISHEKSLSLPFVIDLENTASTEILAKSLAYGLIEGTIKETCTSFENILHNVLVTRGPQGASCLMEWLGDKAGDLAAQKAIEISVQLLIDAATGPVSVPSRALKITNAVTLLDGLLINVIFQRLQDKVAKLKDDLSQHIANQVSTKLCESFEPYAQEQTSQLLLCGGTVVVNIATKELARRALDRATDQIQIMIEDQVKHFMNTCEYMKGYEDYTFPILKFLTVGSGYNLHQTTQLTILAKYPLHEAKAKFEKAVKEDAKKYCLGLRYLGRAVGGFVGKQSGYVVGSYLSHEIADKFIDGMGGAFATKLLDTLDNATTLKLYRDVPQEAYQHIVRREVEATRLIREAAKEKVLRERLEREWGEAVLEENRAIEENERQYEQAYVDAYMVSTQNALQTYVVNPLAYVTNKVKSGVTTGGEKIANGASALVQGVRNTISSVHVYGAALYDWGAEKAYEQMSPDLAHAMGEGMARVGTKALFLKVLENQGMDSHQALSFLTQKIQKDNYYTAGKWAWMGSTWFAQSVCHLTSEVVNLPYTINDELKEAARQGWVSPFHPE